MKKILSVLMAIAMLMTILVLPAYAEEITFDDGWINEEWLDEEWIDPYEGLEIESFTVEATKTLIENVDCEENGYWDENDEWVSEGIVYDVYLTDPYITVVYKTGEVEEGYLDELYGYCEFSAEDEDKEWGIGTHTATAIYRDAQTTFEVEVIENPVKSVTAVAQKQLVADWDSHTITYYDENDKEISYIYYNPYYVEPIFTVTMKDGTVYTGNDEEIYDQTGYWTFDVDNQREKPLKVGKNAVQFEYCGVTFDCEIELLANPYKSISLKGENEVYLVCEGVDAKDSYETRIVEFYWDDWCDAGQYGIITTEDGNTYNVFLRSDLDEDGYPSMDKNVSLQIGTMTTNTLEVCNFFKMFDGVYAFSYNLLQYYETSEELTGEQFNGIYSDEEPNIDDLVAISTYMVAGDGSFYDEGEHGTYRLTAAEAKKNIEKVFGIKNADVRKSSFCNLFGIVEVKYVWGTEWGFSEVELVFEDGQWVITGLVTNDNTGEVIGVLTAILNEDKTIDSVYMIDVAIELGDVNIDGAVTAVDARLILQYVAGLVDEYELNMYYADVNGDGEITAVDARLVLQKVAGLIE